MGGGLAVVQHSDGTAVLQFTNLHGDVVATAELANGVIGIDSYFEQTEFGITRPENTTNPDRYGWPGDKTRSSDALAGLVLMGVRLYNPTTGRFLAVDPVTGGSSNAYDYCNGDPVNCVDLDRRCPVCAIALAGVPVYSFLTVVGWGIVGDLAA